MFDSKVLAGLIDTDGYLEGGYDFCFANKTLRRYRPTFQITGFQVQTSSQLKTCTNAPEDQTMSSLPIIYISGDDLEDIPVLLDRKKITKKEATLRSRTLQDPTRYQGLDSSF
jgi:hypothetical protein